MEYCEEMIVLCMYCSIVVAIPDDGGITLYCVVTLFTHFPFIIEEEMKTVLKWKILCRKKKKWYEENEWQKKKK